MRSNEYARQFIFAFLPLFLSYFQSMICHNLICWFVTISNHVIQYHLVLFFFLLYHEIKKWFRRGIRQVRFRHFEFPRVTVFPFTDTSVCFFPYASFFNNVSRYFRNVWRYIVRYRILLQIFCAFESREFWLRKPNHFYAILI